MADADADGNGLISKSEMPDLLKGLELRGLAYGLAADFCLLQKPSLTFWRMALVKTCENWNTLGEVWDMIPGMSTLSWRQRKCFPVEKQVCLKIHDLRISWFYNFLQSVSQ